MDTRPQCKYGIKCYQKNPNHQKKFSHPTNDKPSKPAEAKRKAEIALSDKDLTTTAADVGTKTAKKAKVEDLSSSSSSNANNNECETSEVVEKFFCDPEEELPSDPYSLEESIKQKFLVEMPEDFYKFWQFCTDLNKDAPLEALSAVGIQLVGVYDVVACKQLVPRCPSRYLCHWRYYHDPPEMQTVLSGCSDGFHIGYFRDVPSEAPVFLASMSDVKPGIVSPLADNIFDAVRVYCIEAGKKADPFKKAAFSKMVTQLETAAKSYGFALDSKAEAVKRRRKKVVCKSFHGAGIVVPFDKQTDVGYREIPETDGLCGCCVVQGCVDDVCRRAVWCWYVWCKAVWMMCGADATTSGARDVVFAHVQELITNAQWATDEGDFGMSLELGMDLFIFGCPHLHNAARHLMTVPYDLLGRTAFSTILKVE
ncbi:Histone PARylation factor 1 [Trinorchestia longiramus]|nr:Histone PARylation factor 1 [Trinorchestia longiramus]